MHRPRLAAIGLLCLTLLAGCAPATPQSAAAPSHAQTSENGAAQPAPPPSQPPVPTATSAPTFAAGSTIAGVEVSGLTFDEAAARLREDLASLPDLQLRAGPARLSVAPAAIELAAPVDELLAEAGGALAAGEPAALPLRLSFDEAALREQLTALAAEVGPAPELTVITSTDVLSRSFAYTPGTALDLNAAVAQVGEALAAGETTTITLDLGEAAATPRVPLEQLHEEVATLAEELPGVVGFHLIDLATGESVGLNERTVFAGASTVKVAIMLNLYVNLEKFSQKQTFWLNEMIRYSDNLSANDLLAAAAGGTGTEYAFEGADQMSTMLQEELGLRHTYLYVPYETTDYIKLYKPKFRCGPAGPVGEKPYTEHGNCLRAEPASMASLYQMIDQCTNDTGPLLEQFDRLTPKRCQEMLDWLAKNGDKTRMVAGVPKGVRVEHKSGWIEDLNADAGIVRSPNGDYALAIYYYRPLTGGRAYWTDEEMAPVVAAFSRLAYTAYNPVPVEQ